MKKLLATILAVIYLSTSMGATVHLHYCMGKLFSWGLANPDKKNCGHCGMAKSNTDSHCMAIKGGCCKDTHTIVKFDKDQKTTELTYKFFTLSFDVVSGSLANLPGLYVNSYIVGYPTTNAPPNPDKVPAFIRNCNFRI
jgi:hypothetical protein